MMLWYTEVDKNKSIIAVINRGCWAKTVVTVHEIRRLLQLYAFDPHYGTCTVK